MGKKPFGQLQNERKNNIPNKFRGVGVAHILDGKILVT
jgi:hypothetical protein